MMIGAGVSRWTMLHLGSAVVAFLIAETLLATGSADPIADLLAPSTLIVVHLLTVGWLSLLMLGALYQFVPVITNTPLFSQRLPILSYAAITLGLAGMVAGFLALAGLNAVPPALLPIGGTLVVVGFGLGVVNVALTLWRARPLPLQAVFVALGLGFLLLTALVGLGFALAFALPDLPGWLEALLAEGLTVHVLGGLGGWVTLTAMGVSYRLLSMFMLAPESPRRITRLVLALTAGGLALFIAARLAVVGGLPVGPAASLGAALALAGAALYLIDIAHLYRTRARRHLELNSIAAAVALAMFGLAILGATAAALTGNLEQFAPALGYLFLFGWLSGLGLSQLYKIVPFMTWLEVFGKRLGKGPVPRVQDLVNERRAAPWFVLWFGAVLAGCAALLAESRLGLQLASLAQLVAALAIAVELWRARHPDPNAAPAPLKPHFKPPIPPHAAPTQHPNPGE